MSVIVVNWDRAGLLRRCLESLAVQREVSFEVIVVDNGSSDESIEVVREFKHFQGFPIQLIENKSNHGFCAANNQGMAKASGEFIALLNNDAEAQPGWLAAMCRELRARPDFGMIASKILVFDPPKRIDKAGHLIYLDGQNRGRGTGELDLGQYETTEEVLWPDGCAALYRKSMLDRIGYFDEDLFAYGDDAELGMRGRLAGWKCLYVPQAVVRHHRGATLGLLSGRRLELIERNRVLLAVKHFPIGLLLLNPFFWTMRVVAGVVAAARGRGEAGKFQGWRGKLVLVSAMVRGLVSGLLLVPRTLKKRRDFKPLRKLSQRELLTLIFRYKISLKTLTEQAA